MPWNWKTSALLTEVDIIRASCSYQVDIAECTQLRECGGLFCFWLFDLFLLMYFINVCSFQRVFVNRVSSQTYVYETNTMTS